MIRQDYFTNPNDNNSKEKEKYPNNAVISFNSKIKVTKEEGEIRNDYTLHFNTKALDLLQPNNKGEGKIRIIGGRSTVPNIDLSGEEINEEFNNFIIGKTEEDKISTVDGTIRSSYLYLSTGNTSSKSLKLSLIDFYKNNTQQEYSNDEEIFLEIKPHSFLEGAFEVSILEEVEEENTTTEEDSNTNNNIINPDNIQESDLNTSNVNPNIVDSEGYTIQ